MIDKNLLKSYALALYSVAKEKNQIEEYLSDLLFLCEIFKRDEKLSKFLSSPMIEKKDKDMLLEENIKDHIHLPVYAFLNVLIRRKAIRYLPEITKEYRHHFNRENGILEGRIYTPFELDEATVSKVTDIFSKKYKKQVVFKVTIDTRVIAGMRIYVDDTLYDYSIDTKLNQVRDALLIDKDR